MSEVDQDRRQCQRVALLKPVACQIGDKTGFVFNVSVHGALVAWETRELGDPSGTDVILRFEWHGRPVSINSRIVHSTIENRETRAGTRKIRKAGIDFIKYLGGSEAVIQAIVAEHVERALDEQKANARGIPPLAASSFQAGTHHRGFICCRLRDGQWSRTPTKSPNQPSDGFTVSVHESIQQIRLLCESYESSDQANRDLIRKMSELSLSQKDGVPTRRYEP